MLAGEGGGRKVDIPAHVGWGGGMETGRYSSPCWLGRGREEDRKIFLPMLAREGGGKQGDIPAHVGQEGGRGQVDILAHVGWGGRKGDR